MIESSEPLASLERLAKEANRLSHHQNLFTQDFLVWHREVVQLLRDTFSNNDPIHKEFCELRFEMPPELVTAAEKHLQRFGPAVPFKGELEDGFFRKAMVRAEEIIQAGIYSLRERY